MHASPDDIDLLLVDGSSYLYRAFMAMPDLSSRRGEPTGALYGFANMLYKLFSRWQPACMVVVLDARGPTFRHQQYAAYKAQRPAMPEALVQQIEPCMELVRVLGFALLRQGGVEADDVIATLAKQSAAQRQKVLVASGDKDLAQLVGSQVHLVGSDAETVLDQAGVRDKFGVEPTQIVDYLTLIGDKVDNIPGVPGVGPKTAARWLNEFQTLDALLAHAETLRGKVGERLREAAAQLPFYRSLIALHCDVTFDETPHLQRQAIDEAGLRALCERYDIRRWRQWLEQEEHGEETTAVVASSAIEAELVLSDEQWQQWLVRIAQHDAVALDCETTGLDYTTARLVGLSVAVPEAAAYIPLQHVGEGLPPQQPTEQVLSDLARVLAGRTIIGQHLKFDRHILHRHGLDLAACAFHDTMLQSYVLDASERHDLDSLAQRELDRTLISYESVVGKGRKQLTFDQVALEPAAAYAAEDAEVTLALHQKQWPRLEANARLLAVYRELELPLVPVLESMESMGVRIDRTQLAHQGQELRQRLETLTRRAEQLAGTPFNLASPAQLGEILFERLALPVVRRTPGGKPSTSEEVLQQLASEHDLPAVILEHRALSKLISTYIDRLPALCDENERVHTSYHQANVITGRLSSSEPNLQNIPVRTEEGRRIRRAFVAAPGMQLLAADYSQIELRIMAHLSGDTRLKNAFAEGEDIHTATALELFGRPDSEDRRKAKMINFGLIYGMSAFGLARRLGVPQPEARAYIDRYFDRYPGVHDYMARMRSKAAQQGYVETCFGRRLHLRDIHSRNAPRRQAAERAAINAPMQGTAADLIKRAMIDLHARLQANPTPIAHLVMQVHDELVLEVKPEHLEAVSEQVRDCMVGAGTAYLSVPLEVSIGSGDNWDAAH